MAHARVAAGRIEDIDCHTWSSEFPHIVEGVIQNAINCAVAEERESCAKVAEAIDSNRGNEAEIARAIRAR